MLPRDDAWLKENSEPTLGPGAVHVWRVDLAITPDEERRLFATLAPDEQTRADRFLAVRARTQFIAARSALRGILSRYTGQRPNEIAFYLGPLGKPSLADPGRLPLYFNLSHSGELALVAVTSIDEIGVDVERIRELNSADALAERFFHPNEVAALRTLPPEQRAVAFFNAWTRKEAFLKATGKGISYGIERVEVTLAPGIPPRVLALDGDRRSAAGWSLESFEAAPGYLGSIAMARAWQHVSRFTFVRPDESQ